MALDVTIPDPPSLDRPTDLGDYDAVDEPEDRTGDDYRRAELAGFLEEGAWADGFDEWAGHTLLDEEEFAVVLELDLVEEFDFYWNPAAGDVGYRAPTVPDDVTVREEPSDRGEADVIEEELDALGRIVSETLENDYVHRDGEEFGYDWEA